MKLNLLDRIVLPGILPKEGSFTDLIIVKDIKKKVSITQEDIKKYKITVQGDALQWSTAGAEAEFEYEFEELETKIIKEALQKKHDEKKATEDMIHLYTLFLQ